MQMLHMNSSEAVAYHIPTTPPTLSHPILKTTIALPRHSQWTSGPHFHARHTESLRLVQGAIYVSLGRESQIWSAKAGGRMNATQQPEKSQGLVIHVPRYARHEWMRASAWYARRGLHGWGPETLRPEDVDDEVVVEEWTDPSDLGKPLFFWNLNGVVAAAQDGPVPLGQRVLRWGLGRWWVPFQLFVIFWDLDNWPVFGLRPWVFEFMEGPLEYVLSFLVLFTAKVLGWLVGVRAVEQGRTPSGLWEQYSRKGV
ncbi:hypothetical protein BDU57DRAFT_591161 [Ampelomyces quisqualis]|uniref:Uncharacterized protein n=1 Tax=Ampelomyces quisqualis TaxID=50730 RepID=A0A6A5Q6B1_AMPQU|nr:hypothetical protein BDU57DRAFT_591161 [Ampelomyces quisqualis]